MREIIWLKKKGFDQDGNTWSKILEGAELIEYFEIDADATYKIETGEILGGAPGNQPGRKNSAIYPL